MNSLFIFRLDLRLKDNTGLIDCVKNSENVYISFIFEPKQIDRKKNDYFSDNCVQFMIESLKELYTKSDNKLIFCRFNGFLNEEGACDKPIKNFFIIFCLNYFL